MKLEIRKMLGGTMKGDLPSYIILPFQWVAVVFVLAVLILAWTQAQPTLSSTAATFGLPLTGTAVAGIPGLNQTTYLNVGNQLYSFDPYLAFIFFFLLIAVALSTLFLSPNPIGWYIGILFAPFLFWISSYVSNFAYEMFTQPALATVLPYLKDTITIMAQLPVIVFLFYIIYLIGLSVRVMFYNPQQSNSTNAELQAALDRRMGR